MGETDMNGNRDAWLTDLGKWVPELSCQEFLDLYLPEMDSDTLDAVRSKLEDSDALSTKSTRKSRWKAFPKAPEDYALIETDVFQKLESIFSSIAAAGEEVLSRKPNAYFRSTPEKSFESEVMNATFRSDGCFTIAPKEGDTRSSEQSTGLGGKSSKGDDVTVASNAKTTQHCTRRTRSASAKDTQHAQSSTKSKGRRGGGKRKSSETLQLPGQQQHVRIRESEVVALFEGKKTNTKEKLSDDIRKVVGGASHCLYNDPCRRFMFGWTIENTDTRLWYFGRSSVVVSRKFDFQKDVDILIRFAASLMFAKDHELGYDPTVERYIDKAGQIRYKYMVEGICYLTVQVLSDYLSTRIIGRSTRVWKVCRWEDRDLENPPYFALKDYWIDEASPTEREIQREIFSRINKINRMDDIGDPQQWSQYFMTIKAEEIISFDDEGHRFVDRTIPVPDSRQAFHLRTLQTTTAKPGTSVRSKPEGATSDLPSDNPKRRHRLFSTKKHCRLVFEEVGERLDSLTDLKSVFTALEHGAHALKLMYTAGYVHRDISAGNILLCGERGKLSDLEYSRPFEELVDEESLGNEVHHPPSDEKTGTPAFMAIEISAEVYYWAAFSNHAQDPVQHFMSGLKATSASQSTPAVVHNYLHDLESLWWIGCYALLMTTPTISLADGLAPSLSKQKQHTEEIFPHAMGPVQARIKVFTSPTDFGKVCRVLASDSLPLAYDMVEMSGELVTQYEEFEKDMEAYRLQQRFGPVYNTVSLKLVHASLVATADVTHLSKLDIPIYDIDDDETLPALLTLPTPPTAPTPDSTSQVTRSQSSRGSKRKARVEDGVQNESAGSATKRPRKPRKGAS